MSALETATRIRHRQQSSRDAVEATFARIDALNPELGAVVIQDRERALAAAEAADRRAVHGDELPPFHGVPMTIKEQYAVRGWKTTLGIPELADNVAAESEDLVRKLEALGFIIVGKTNVPTGLSDHQTFNPLYGRTNHPLDPSLTPGGSSGGSAAALAAGITEVELGSDIAGSLRVPAHFCGVYSHKPTHGLLTTHLPSAHRPEDMATPGPMATDPAVLSAILPALTGDSARNEPPARLRPARLTRLDQFRVGVWSNDARAPVLAEYAEKIERFADRLAEAGCRVDREVRPANDAALAARTGLTLMFAVMSGYAPPHVVADIAGRRDAYDPEDGRAAACRARGFGLSHLEWHRLDEQRWRDAAAWDELFDSVDLMLLPVYIDAAFAHDTSEPADDRTLVIDGRTRRHDDSFFWIMQAHPAGLPATTMPIGTLSDGRPVGIQIIARRHEDLTALRFAELVTPLSTDS